MLTTNQTSKLPYQKVRLCSLNLKKKYVSSQKDTDTSIMHSISPFDSKDTNSHTSNYQEDGEHSYYYFSDIDSKTEDSFEYNLNKTNEESLSLVNCEHFSIEKKNKVIIMKEDKASERGKKRSGKYVKRFLMIMLIDVLLISLFLIKAVDEYKLRRLLAISEKEYKFKYYYHNFSELI